MVLPSRVPLSNIAVISSSIAASHPSLFFPVSASSTDSGSVWYKEIDKTLQEVRYKRFFADYGRYHRGTREDRVLLAIYVDDIRLVGKQLRKVEEAKSEFIGRYNMTDGGELTYVLGMEVHKD